MGTSYSVKLMDLPDSVDVDGLGAEIKRRLQRINSLMSTYSEESEISRFNRSPSKEWFSISAETQQVVALALDICERSEGAFDITLGPVVNLWGFGPGEQRSEVPLPSEVSRALARVGCEHLESRALPPALKKRLPDLYVDLSAIAKGYAVDLVADYLETQGLSNYLVEVGGEIRAKGVNAKDAPWQVAVEKPSAGERRVQRIVGLNDQAIATSGDYRNYFEHQGKRYNHTLDPKTGNPVTHSLASVAVISDSAMYADAMATALMVLGPDRGYDLAMQEGLPTLFIIRAAGGFVEKHTPSFEQYMKAPPKP
jgi:thiamine biosynthesis lipoprotein